MALLIVLSLFVMAAIDFVTGQELVFSCAYLVPVSLTAWYFNRRAMIGMSIASGLSAILVDRLDGYAYSHPGIEWWNAFTCLIIALVTGHVLTKLRGSLEQRKTANQELREALEKLEASTREVRKLQSGLQTVCAWTKRIKVGEEWMTPEDFLRTQLNLQLSHGISPEAFEEYQRQLAGTTVVAQ